MHHSLTLILSISLQCLILYAFFFFWNRIVSCFYSDDKKELSKILEAIVNL